MSKTKTLKKTILICMAVWLVFVTTISVIVGIWYTKGYFHSPTEEEYTNLIMYVYEIKDDFIENEKIRDSFLNENMEDLVIDISEGDIKADIEVTSKGIYIKAEKGNCIIEKEYELKKEYVLLEDGTKEAKGLILVANDTVQSKNTFARNFTISLYVVATLSVLVCLLSEIAGKKKKEEKAKTKT